MSSNGDNNGNRTHEPSLRELTAELDGLRELLDARIQAQADALTAADKRYEQRFVAQETAVQSALVGQEKAVNAALIAADRAVIKAESAAEKRFDSVNEFRAQLADQAAGFLPRAEASIRFETLSEKVDSLVKSRDTGVGRIETETTFKGQSNQDRAIYVSLIVAAALIAATFIATHH